MDKFIIDGQEYPSRGDTLKLVSTPVRMHSFMVNSDKLTTLIVNNNDLEEFEARGIPKLYRLDLSYNKISSFVTASLPQLRYLSLYNNRLTEFKADASNFPNLNHLGLSNNEIVEFCLKGTFAELNHIQLTSNRLSKFKVGISAPRLQFLNLDNNPNLEVLDFIHLRNWRLSVLLANTAVKFVDKSLIGCIQDRDDLEIREHQIETSSMVAESFHQDNPLVDEIIGELKI